MLLRSRLPERLDLGIGLDVLGERFAFDRNFGAGLTQRETAVGANGALLLLARYRLLRGWS